MDKIATVYHFVIANAALELPIVYAVLTFFNGVLKDSPTRSLVGNLLNWLSVHTRSDADGTFKLPFTGWTPAPAAEKTSPGKRVANLDLLLLTLGTLHLLSGCTPAGKLYGKDYAACMQAAGLAAVPDVEAQAGQILSSAHDVNTAVAALEGLGKSVAGSAAISAVECAVSAWLHPSHPAALNPAGVEAAKRYLAAHGHAQLRRHQRDRMA